MSDPATNFLPVLGPIAVIEITGTSILNALVPLHSRVLETDMFDRIRARSGRKFLIAWTGPQVPSGAVVNGIPILQTMDGFVKTSGQPGRADSIIGIYDRLIKDSGENHDEHLMLVYLDPDLS